MQLTASTRVLVTGANGGIGQAIARTLAHAGAHVIVSGRKAEAVQRLAAEINGSALVADLENRDDVARLAEQAGAVDVLVANAGLPAPGPLLDFTEGQIDRALEVNLRAPMMLARALGAGMVSRRSGQIVFISSIAGKIPAAGAAVYAATKFGMRGCALSLREDLDGTGVGVSVIYPGFIREAGMFADSGIALPAGLGTRSPENVAEAVLRAIRKNPAELSVASGEQIFGAFLAGLSPAFSSAMAKAFGARKLSIAMGEGQKHRR